MAFIISSIIALAIAFTNAEYPGNIPGPKRLDESIAIIGGGMTAIHMAYLMKNRGFTNVTVLVSGNRLGSEDIYSHSHRGTVHELGKFMLIPSSMSDELESLMQRFGLGAMREITLPTVWVGDDTFISLDAYILQKARPFFPNQNDATIRNNLVQRLTQFTQAVNSRVSGSDDAPVPNEPSWQQKFGLAGNFEDFLARNNLQVLSPLFTYLFGMIGYGRCQDVPAMYGIYFFKSKLLNAIRQRLQGGTGVKGFKMTTQGLQAVMDRIQAAAALNVVRNVKINEIKPVFANKYHIDMDVNGANQKRQYDFLVFTEDLKDYVRLNPMRQTDEYQVFLRPQTKYLIKTLVDSENVRRGDSPVEFFPRSFEQGQMDDYKISYAMDTYANNRGNEGITYRLNSFQNSADLNDQNQRRKSAVYTQLSKGEPNIATANAVLRNYLQARNGQNVAIQKTVVHKFMPLYTDRDLNNGILYRILKMQGKNNIWYLGKSAFFDDIVSSMAYNKFILQKFTSL